MGVELIAGVDEAGRGPLAGRVYAAAVILGSGTITTQVRDSKQLSARRRDRLYGEIQEGGIATSIAWAEAREIDEWNILQATMLAMRRAVLGLGVVPDRVLVDGNRCPDLPMAVSAVIGGDRTIPEISAASILAKVARDRYMLELDERHPEYGFAKHKGYPTEEHRNALRKYGPCPEHRRSFAPVARCLSVARDGHG